MPRAQFKIRMTRQDLSNRIGRAAFVKFDRIGRMMVAAVKADISTPVTVTSVRPGKRVGGVRVRRGRGPFRGRRVVGSKPGEFPRKETGELFRSVRYRVRFALSLNSPLVLEVFSTAKHGRMLEEKSASAGGRKWMSRTIARLLPRLRATL